LIRIGFLSTVDGVYFDVYKMYEFKNQLEKDMQKVVEILAKKYDIVYPGLVANMADAHHASKKFRAEELDLIIVCEAGYTGSWQPLAALEGCDHIPVLLWMYKPREDIPIDLDLMEVLRSAGVNGTVELAQTFRRKGMNFSFIVGTPYVEETIKQIDEYIQIAALRRYLKDANIALIPYRCPLMPDTFEDEFKFTQRIGPKITNVSVEELRTIFSNVPQEEVVKEVLRMKETYTVLEPEEEDLKRGARFKIALERLAEIGHFNGISLWTSEEFFTAFGVTPEAGVENLDDKGIMVATEGDVSALTSMMILNHLTGSPAMFCEFLSYDKRDNTVLMGHWGPAGIKMARSNKEVALTTPHVSLDWIPNPPPHGVAVEYIAKPGEVTILNLSCDDKGYKMVFFSGDAIDTSRRHIHFPHAIIKLRRPVDQFFKDLTEEGVKHHFALAHGNLTKKLAKLADLLVIRGLEI